MVTLGLLLLIVEGNDLLLLEQSLHLVSIADRNVHLLLGCSRTLLRHELRALPCLWLELVVAELVQLLLRPVQTRLLSWWVASVVKHLLLLLLRVPSVPGGSALLLCVLAHLLVLVNDLQFAFHEAFQLPALPRRESVDVDFYFVLGNVLALRDDLADHPEVFRRQLPDVLAQRPFLLDAHRLVHVDTTVRLAGDLAALGLVQVLELPGETVHPPLQLVNMDILVTLNVLVGLLEVLTQLLTHDVNVRASRVIQLSIGPDLTHVHCELHHGLQTALFQLPFHCRQVHGLFHNVEIVRNIEHVRVHCLLERSGVLVFPE